ncbi:hypothetical protein [Roseobacter sinensis]|uniref:Lipoprotein n=1 Tax=Roseobacter sinensis TaxID=2931391 RepID=A0ABT3BC55_9RHOB|nr:hypothetical protein [Roseobacter sp. WL0113]MCV3271156.1 hypothetical protein [Roseobacter sp. WL0113]
MKTWIQALLLIGSLGLVACTQPETYPISGETCGPDDPVLDLDAADCGTPGLI